MCVFLTRALSLAFSHIRACAWPNTHSHIVINPLLGLCSAVASRRMNVWASDILTCFDTEALECLLESDFLVIDSEEALLDAILEFARDDGFTDDGCDSRNKGCGIVGPKDDRKNKVDRLLPKIRLSRIHFSSLLNRLQSCTVLQNCKPFAKALHSFLAKVCNSTVVSFANCHHSFLLIINCLQSCKELCKTFATANGNPGVKCAGSGTGVSVNSGAIASAHADGPRGGCESSARPLAVLTRWLLTPSPLGQQLQNAVEKIEILESQKKSMDRRVVAISMINSTVQTAIAQVLLRTTN